MSTITKESIEDTIEGLEHLAGSSIQSVYIDMAIAGMRRLQASPVSVPDKIEPTVEAIKRVLPTSNPDEYAACIGADMWNACRAAMLDSK